MHKILFTVVTLSLVGLLSCSSESGGGSDAPVINLEGSWEGLMVADDVVEDGVGNTVESISDGTFVTNFQYQGSDPSDGSIGNPVIFCQSFADDDCPFERTCPEVRPTLTGTQRGNDIVANIRANFGDFMKWKLEVVGTDRIKGTYEYLSESNAPCKDTTGEVTICRRCPAEQTLCDTLTTCTCFEIPDPDPDDGTVPPVLCPAPHVGA
jgi:hypothetical protein